LRLTRFYQDVNLEVGDTLALDDRASYHLVSVLRAKAGQKCTVFNGNGFEYLAEVLVLDGKHAKIEVLQKKPAKTESRLIVRIAQAVSKGERMDYMVQKATELGVSEIIPILGKRVIVKLDEKRWQKKLEHWRKIAISAAEQSFRIKIPRINQPVDFGEYVKATTIENRYIMDTEASTKFSELPSPNNEIAILIGPEGGFAKEEILLAKEHGFKQISLGPRVLRTETVAPVCLALTQSLWGDL